MDAAEAQYERNDSKSTIIIRGEKSVQGSSPDNFANAVAPDLNAAAARELAKVNGRNNMSITTVTDIITVATATATAAEDDEDDGVNDDKMLLLPIEEAVDTQDETTTQALFANDATPSTAAAALLRTPLLRNIHSKKSLAAIVRALRASATVL